MRIKSRAYTLQRKTYYLEEEIYKLIRDHDITRDEIEFEYARLLQITPSVKITYNHAAYQAFLRKTRQL